MPFDRQTIHNAHKRQTLIFAHDPQPVQPHRAANPRRRSRWAVGRFDTK